MIFGSSHGRVCHAGPGDRSLARFRGAETDVTEGSPRES
jgi:hypothetical protein